MARVAVFPTCVVDTVGAGIGAATVRVLRRLGYEVVVPDDATCCGQPAWNAGFARESAKVAKTTLEALDGCDCDLVCIPAGSCATMVKVFWPELFHVTDDEASRERAERLRGKVVEFSELVARHADELDGVFPRKAAYHHSCHMLRELRLKETPETVLDALDGCERLAWSPADERCCGFGGLFSVKQPETSVAMADDKIDALPDATDVVVGCDASCLLHLAGRMWRRGDHTPVRHLAEVVDAAQAEAAVRGTTR